MTSQRGQAEVEKEAESLKAEVASLQQKLKELKQEEATRRDRQVPLAPDAYYEEKVRDTRSLLGLQNSAGRRNLCTQAKNVKEKVRDTWSLLALQTSADCKLVHSSQKS